MFPLENSNTLNKGTHFGSIKVPVLLNSHVLEMISTRLRSSLDSVIILRQRDFPSKSKAKSSRHSVYVSCFWLISESHSTTYQSRKFSGPYPTWNRLMHVIVISSRMNCPSSWKSQLTGLRNCRYKPI